MHIVFLNHYAGTPALGMSYRPYYLAQEWLKQGHKVTIIAATYSHIRTHNKDYKEKFTRENIDGIDYIWIKTCQYKGNGLGRIRSMFQYVCGVFRLIPALVKEKPDAVIASSTYPFDNYPAYRLAKKSGAKYIFEVHDLWPLSPMELGGYSKYHPFIVMLQIAENFAYRHVDKVVSILPCTLQHMLEHGLPEERFAHIPNGILLDEVNDPEPLSAEVAARIPEGKFIVGYCGTFGISNALHDLIETAAITEKDHPEIHYCMVGKGPLKENIVKLIADKNLKNVTVFDAIPKKQVQSFLKRCDLLAITWNNSPLYRFGISPNKLFDYMYSGKPVVQSVVAGNDIPKDSGCGITCKPEPAEIVKAVLQIYNMSKAEQSAMGAKGKEYVLNKHDYFVLAKKFIDVIEE